MLNLGANKKYNIKQNRITVNFRLTSEEEQKLFKWIKESAAINGDSAFIKSILYKEFIKQQKDE